MNVGGGTAYKVIMPCGGLQSQLQAKTLQANPLQNVSRHAERLKNQGPKYMQEVPEMSSESIAYEFQLDCNIFL